MALKYVSASITCGTAVSVTCSLAVDDVTLATDAN